MSHIEGQQCTTHKRTELAPTTHLFHKLQNISEVEGCWLHKHERKRWVHGHKAQRFPSLWSTLSKVNSQGNIRAKSKFCPEQNSATALRSKQEHKRCVIQPSGSTHAISIIPKIYPHPLNQPTLMPQNQMASLMLPAHHILKSDLICIQYMFAC